MKNYIEIYQVTRTIDDITKVLFESSDYDEAAYQYDLITSHASDFAYACYGIETIKVAI